VGYVGRVHRSDNRRGGGFPDDRSRDFTEETEHRGQERGETLALCSYTAPGLTHCDLDTAREYCVDGGL